MRDISPHVAALETVAEAWRLLFADVTTASAALGVDVEEIDDEPATFERVVPAPSPPPHRALPPPRFPHSPQEMSHAGPACPPPPSHSSPGGCAW